MMNRKMVLSAAALLAATQVQAAVPTLDTPPVTAQFSTTYYSNIAQSSGLFATARGISRDDILYAPTVLANLVKPYGGLTFFLQGQAGYEAYQNNSVLDREHIDLQAGADTYVSVCDTTVTGAWSRGQSSLMDLSIAATKNTLQTLTPTLAVSCDRMGRLVPTASVSETWASNSAPLYVSQDYHSFVANAGLGYNYEPIGLVSLFGQYVQSSYPHRLFGTGVGPQSDGYNLYSGGLRYTRDIGARIQISASLTETSLSTDNSIGKGFSGLTYDLNLNYKPDERWVFTGDFGRDVSPSFYLNADYAVQEKYSGSVGYRFTSRLTASAGVSDTHANYVGAALVPGTDISDQTYWSYYGTVAFNVSPTFSVSLNAGEDGRHANVVGYSYSGAHVGLALSKAFSF